MERIGAFKIPGMIDGLFWGLNCCTSIYSGKIVIIVVQRPHIDLTVISGGNHPLCGLYISRFRDLPRFFRAKQPDRVSSLYFFFNFMFFLISNILCITDAE